MSVTVQYVIVGAIILAAAIWIVVRLRRKRQGKDSGCHGCSLYDACKHKRSPRKCLPEKKN